MLTRRIARVAAVVLMLTAAWSGSAIAGETQVYLKSGYFTWNEKINGSDFVKENGMMTAFGVARSDTLFGNVVLEELIEVWGGSLDYDGHDVTNTTVLKSDTVYLGTREEFTAGIKFPLGGNLSAGPLAGIGHKFWIRTRSNEDWNAIYGKLGAAADYKAAAYGVFVNGGVQIPIYTRSHVSLGAAGFEDVVTNPKSKPSVFAEIGVRRAAWSIGVTYEEMNFAKSDSVSTKSTTPLQNGVAVINSLAFQPDSSSSLVAFKVRYHF